MNEESLIACFACAMFSFRMLHTVLVSPGVEPFKTCRSCLLTCPLEARERNELLASEFAPLAREKALGTSDWMSYSWETSMQLA